MALICIAVYFVVGDKPYSSTVALICIAVFTLLLVKNHTVVQWH